jgi:hypothetical protein
VTGSVVVAEMAEVLDISGYMCQVKTFALVSFVSRK